MINETMTEDFADKLLRVVEDGLKEIRQQITELRQEISELLRGHLELESKCNVCRAEVTAKISTVLGRVQYLEERRKQNDAQDKGLATVKWTTATKIIVALLGIIGLMLAGFLERFISGYNGL